MYRADAARSQARVPADQEEYSLRCWPTDVPGVFVAGNIIDDVQLAIVAAAEGTRAAFGINRSLTRETSSVALPVRGSLNIPGRRFRRCAPQAGLRVLP